MQTLIVLFRLKPGASVADYEAWARSTDLPVVRALPSVASFELFRVQGLFGTGGRAPYDYVEAIQIRDPAGFGPDVGTPTMRKVAAEFRQFADDPVFMLTEAIGGEAPWKG